MTGNPWTVQFGFRQTPGIRNDESLRFAGFLSNNPSHSSRSPKVLSSMMHTSIAISIIRQGTKNYCCCSKTRASRDENPFFERPNRLQSVQGEEVLMQFMNFFVLGPRRGVLIEQQNQLNSEPSSQTTFHGECWMSINNFRIHIQILIQSKA